MQASVSEFEPLRVSLCKCERVSRASVSGIIFSLWHHSGPPAPDDEYFVANLHWDKLQVLHKNPNEIGCWGFLEDSDTLSSVSSSCAASGTVCGVELTNSQIKDTYLLLSTQQTTDFLAQFDADHALANSQDFRQLKQLTLTNATNLTEEHTEQEQEEVHLSRRWQKQACLANLFQNIWRSHITININQ